MNNKLLNSSMFPVIEVPAVGSLDQVGAEIDDTGYKFIVREDTNQVVSCVTDKYKLVTNEEVVNKSVPVLEKYGAKLQECKMFGNGARTQWTWNLPASELTVLDGDIVNPQIIIKNSYDASLQISILGGIFRLVCSNGAVIGDIYGKHNSRHTIWNKSINNGWISNRVEKTCNAIDEHLTEDLGILRDTEIVNTDIPKVIKKFPEVGVTEIVQYLTNNNPKSYWDLLNAATFVFTHHLNRNNETTHNNEAIVYSQVLNMAKIAAKA